MWDARFGVANEVVDVRRYADGETPASGDGDVLLPVSLASRSPPKAEATSLGNQTARGDRQSSTKLRFKLIFRSSSEL